VGFRGVGDDSGHTPARIAFQGKWMTYWSAGKGSRKFTTLDGGLRHPDFPSPPFPRTHRHAPGPAFLVLRTGSDYTVPAAGPDRHNSCWPVRAAEGCRALSAYAPVTGGPPIAVGSTVVNEIAGNWAIYAERTPAGEK